MRPDMPCNRRRLVRLGLGLAAWRASSAWAQLPLAASAPSTAASASAPGLATPLVADPALEARVMAVAQELRCLVCQNETIAASQADLAQDLRAQIRLKLQQGQSPQQIVDFMVARYGDFVRYRPAFKGTTLLLWLGPFAFLLAAVAGLAWVIRRRRQLPAQALSEAEQARARALLQSALEADAPPSAPASSSSSSSLPASSS